MPSLEAEGAVYPPGPTASLLSNVVFILRLLLIGAILGGTEGLAWLGINNPPEWFLWMSQNKITAVLLVVVLGSQIENHLLSTGAFEVYVNDQLVWSKLESGRLPSLPEFKDLLQQPSVTFSNVDPMSEAAA